MSNIKRAAAALAFTALSLSAAMAPAHAAGPQGTAADYGMQVPNNAATRIIEIKPDTKWVNVTNGETVLFVANGKAFAWHFNTFGNTTSFDLSKIAPESVMVSNVRAYVASNPLYRG